MKDKQTDSFSRRPAPRVPWWFYVVLVIAVLPLTFFPGWLSEAPAETLENKVLLWIYPFYVVVAAFLAWQTYGRRTDMSWILIILLLLTHAAIWRLLHP